MFVELGNFIKHHIYNHIHTHTYSYSTYMHSQKAGMNISLLTDVSYFFKFQNFLNSEAIVKKIIFEKEGKIFKI